MRVQRGHFQPHARLPIDNGGVKVGRYLSLHAEDGGSAGPLGCLSRFGGGPGLGMVGAWLRGCRGYLELLGCHPLYTSFVTLQLTVSCQQTECDFVLFFLFPTLLIFPHMFNLFSVLVSSCSPYLQ
nr:hypothetical protein B14D6.640 [imported] - Neurospora crassa [Neurospora crassa]